MATARVPCLLWTVMDQPGRVESLGSGASWLCAWGVVEEPMSEKLKSRGRATAQ